MLRFRNIETNDPPPSVHAALRNTNAQGGSEKMFTALVRYADLAGDRMAISRYQTASLEPFQ